MLFNNFWFPLKKMQKKLARHEDGSKPLPPHKREQFEKKVRAYKHQIEELSRDLEPEEIERVLDNNRKARDQMRLEEL